MRVFKNKKEKERTGKNPCDPKWKAEFYVLGYRLAAAGQDDSRIAKAMNVTKATLTKWHQADPAFRKALEDGRARGRKAGIKAFMQHVTDRMPDDLREIWERLSSDDDNVRKRACADVKAYEKMQQQHFYLQALVAMDFKYRAAAEAIGIEWTTACQWRMEDGDFKKLTDVMRMCLGDFYENALIELVHSGDSAAIIHASRTFNADRGYSSKDTLRIEGEVKQTHRISIKELSPETKRAMLQEMRAKREALPDNSRVIDAEFTPVNGKVKHE